MPTPEASLPEFDARPSAPRVIPGSMMPSGSRAHQPIEGQSFRQRCLYLERLEAGLPDLDRSTQATEQAWQRLSRCWVGTSPFCL